jgi:hypothetical protein
MSSTTATTSTDPIFLAEDGCTVCGKKASQLCGQCQASRYCSKECQQTDWNLHKFLCGTYKDFKVRPSKDSRLAIVFSCKKKKPEFIWIKCPKDVLGKENELDHVKELLGCKSTGALHLDMDWAFGNPIRNLILVDGPIKILWNLEQQLPAHFLPPQTDKKDAYNNYNAALHASLSSGAVWMGKDMAPVEYL